MFWLYSSASLHLIFAYIHFEFDAALVVYNMYIVYRNI